MLNMVYILADACYDSIGVTIPEQIVKIISTVINLIKIVVPILLVIFGMLDLGKAVAAQKEDEIKKGQQTLIKRLIAAAIVFFVVFLVQMVIGLVAGGDDNIWKCVSYIINGKS